MAALASAVVALSGWDKKADDFADCGRLSLDLIAKLPTIAAAWQRRARPGGTFIGVAGDVDPGKVRDTVERLLEGWQLLGSVEHRLRSTA
mgnify:CR=1 FL=1